MGKAARWLRKFLLGKKEKKTATRPPATSATEKFSAAAAAEPALKERRRWSFQRPPAKATDSADPVAPKLVRQLSESEIDRRRAAAITAVMAGAAEVAAQVVVAPPRRSTGGVSRSHRAMVVAATKIQSVFRSYLARKALSALKGLVKLQAMVRGHLVRKQATATLRCMQSLVMAQARARAQRMRMAEVAQHSPQQQPIHRRKSQDFRFQKSSTSQVAPEDIFHRFANEINRDPEEDVKTVEMDFSEPRLREPRASFKSRKYPITQTERKDQRLATYCYGGQEQYQQFSPAQSAFMDINPRDYSDHSGEVSFTKAKGSPQSLSAVSVSNTTQASFGPSNRSYMANTESSRAKARSHSAPKQRPDTYEKQTSRRSSVEGRNNSRGVKMQQTSSRENLTANGHQYPRSIKLNRSSMSLMDSECGSTNTKLTNTSYCRPLVAYEVQIY